MIKWQRIRADSCLLLFLRQFTIDSLGVVTNNFVRNCSNVVGTSKERPRKIEGRYREGIGKLYARYMQGICRLYVVYM